MKKKNKVLEEWDKVKLIIESIKLDIHKNAKGNCSAGVRARKGLRDLKEAANDMIKLTIEEDKKIKELRAERRRVKEILKKRGVEF